ncbi:unnamed protein product [Acanthoscelides obtectus]|uniref:Uncharacterized protein n=1 Tax=Acanthoscelides obtectus TaxID=200917 RepID=A0A9P0KHI9_ACAOB|nr:unnamed protein product [Acanthoscelides obtectus]CAK1681696.1 hypothetical protein AOBTE_LOCUS33224 [Acanthoscelides obtectus]
MENKQWSETVESDKKSLIFCYADHIPSSWSREALASLSDG